MKSSNFIGVSLGTCNTHIYKRGRGIVLGEPSVVACDAYDENKIIAMGYRAKKNARKNARNNKCGIPDQ